MLIVESIRHGAAYGAPAAALWAAWSGGSEQGKDHLEAVGVRKLNPDESNDRKLIERGYPIRGRTPARVGVRSSKVAVNDCQRSVPLLLPSSFEAGNRPRRFSTN
jgi:hypothetical protein